jgi:hypothetical protein
LLEPATNAIGNAQAPQLVGLVVGSIGLLLVLVEGFYLLAGVDIKGVQPELIYETAEADGGALATDPGAFHLSAAADLKGVWEENDDKLRRVVGLFRIFVVGLVLELVGLGAAALIRPSQTHKTMQAPVPASLHLTHAHLGQREVSIAGELSPGAKGRVRIAVALLGQAGEAMSLSPSVHNGRFSVRIRVGRRLAPLRSVSYTITWSGSSSVASSYLAGTIARCPGDCQ